jgi:DNA replication protein DnaC
MEQDTAARIRRAHLPAGYAQASFANFSPVPQFRTACLLASCYADEFPPLTKGEQPGLLFSGNVGTGKTHLAAAIVQAIARRGFQPLFVDLRELLDRLRSSYDDSATESQAQIMRPIFAADLVVIDELGAARPTDWIFETQELLIGGLYNRMTPTLVTTNLPNLAAGAATSSGYERAARPETLGDRIGMRMFSRLQQMCRPIPMNGPDWRARKE